MTLKGVTVKGDLIIGDGVGTGDVTLDAVKVEGRTVVRGGGKNSIHVINGSTITGTVIVDNVNNEVRIVTDQGTTVRKVEADSQVVLEGSFGDVKVVGDASGGASIEIKGNIQTLTIEAKADITLTSGMVTRVEVSQTAGGTTINTSQEARIETVTANARTNVTGSGTVSNVEAKANDVKVDTAGTKVTADQGATGVTAGGNTVAGGSSTTTAPSTPATPATGGSSGGNSGDNSGGTGNARNIALTASKFSLVTGSKAGTTISVNPSDATLSFSSANTAVAAVNQTTGEVTGIAAGTATITVNASRTGYTSASAAFTVTVVDIALSAVSDKNTDGMFDPNGTYSYVDIDIHSDNYYLTTASDQKEGFTVTVAKPGGGPPALIVQSAEIHGGGPGQGSPWMRVKFSPAVDDFTTMHLYYNQLNGNPVKKSDGTDMPSFSLNVEKEDGGGIVTGPTVSNAAIYSDGYSIKLTMSSALTNRIVEDDDAGFVVAVTGAASNPVVGHVLVQESEPDAVLLCLDNPVDMAAAINGGVTVSYTPTGTILTDGTTPVAAFSVIPVTTVVGDYTAAVAGTYGPDSGTSTVTGSVYIDIDGVTLQNLVINGNLTFGAGIGSGDAYINNVTVLGDTIVNGGGSHSIHIQGDSSLGDVTVDDQTGITGNEIHIVNEGTSQIASINVKEHGDPESPDFVLTHAIIDDNSQSSGSNIGYIKSDEPDQVECGGNNSSALVRNIYDKSISVIDEAISDIDNDSRFGTAASAYEIYALKQYMYPLSLSDPDKFSEADTKFAEFYQLWAETYPLINCGAFMGGIPNYWLEDDYYESIKGQQDYLNSNYDLYELIPADYHYDGGDLSIDGRNISVADDVYAAIEDLQAKVSMANVDTTSTPGAIEIVLKYSGTGDGALVAGSQNAIISFLTDYFALHQDVFGIGATASFGTIDGQNIGPMHDISLQKITITPGTGANIPEGYEFCISKECFIPSGDMSGPVVDVKVQIRNGYPNPPRNP